MNKSTQLLLFICMSKASKSGHSGEADVESKEQRQDTEVVQVAQGPIVLVKHICGDSQRWKWTNFLVNKPLNRSNVF